LVLKNRAVINIIKAVDIILTINAETLSFLWILISDHKNIKAEIPIISNDSHIESPSLTITLKNIYIEAIHRKSKTALVCTSILYTFLKELLTLRKSINRSIEDIAMRTRSIVKLVLKYTYAKREL
jgi:hypothetical protein